MRTCRVVQPTVGYRGKQGLSYFSGLSAENVGAEGICMHLLEIPPGARAKAHFHENHETTIFVLEGRAEMRYGPNLEESLSVSAGDFVYIPAGVPHLPYNPFSQPARAVVARTDPNEQESVVLCPELDEPFGSA